jgi:hypothetical protein
MEKHPTTSELRRIHLIQTILITVALATVVLIGVLAMKGAFEQSAVPVGISHPQH